MGMSDTCRSITGNIFRYNSAPIQWKSKLQLAKSVALVTAEAELLLGSELLGAVAVVYLRKAAQAAKKHGIRAKPPMQVYAGSGSICL